MAGRTGSKRHTHKYFRLFADQLWHCGDSRCTHYMPGNMPPPVWKDSICWMCDRIFELTPDNMKYDNPTCDNCPPYKATTTSNSNLDDITAWIERKEKEARALKSAKPIIEPPVEKDEIEVDEIETIDEVQHAPYCGVFAGLDCDCKGDN